MNRDKSPNAQQYARSQSQEPITSSNTTPRLAKKKTETTVNSEPLAKKKSSSSSSTNKSQNAQKYARSQSQETITSPNTTPKLAKKKTETTVNSEPMAKKMTSSGSSTKVQMLNSTPDHSHNDQSRHPILLRKCLRRKLRPPTKVRMLNSKPDHSHNNQSSPRLHQRPNHPNKVLPGRSNKHNPQRRPPNLQLLLLRTCHRRRPIPQ